ncbi:vacuolar protein sorting-associated protein 37B [Leptopilina boulardi]|uniref:vacuolar protein sorting-associated protein 37B n=1 Tax=Leptopilina boulardi TaxID=63433 RepID=UPI0021F5F38B|nr:vacuolar protein sorting-associated protein 37B [Leptopilina boulardi]XP_051160641.1 vacuolar protein sorting-associated protein 37B [Leptopilina boulardi]
MYKQNFELDTQAALRIIKNMSNDELKELLNDDEKFEEVIKNVEQFKEYETEKEMLMASNRSLAEYNLARQPELEEGKQELRELSEKGSLLCTSINEKLDEIKEKPGMMSVDTALDMLQTAASEIDEQSETVAKKFVDGEIEVDEFLDQYLSLRLLVHLRKVKVEKMQELIKSKDKGVGYPALGKFPGMSPSLPYPSGIVSMPMPVQMPPY